MSHPRLEALLTRRAVSKGDSRDCAKTRLSASCRPVNVAHTLTVPNSELRKKMSSPRAKLVPPPNLEADNAVSHALQYSPSNKTISKTSKRRRVFLTYFGFARELLPHARQPKTSTDSRALSEGLKECRVDDARGPYHYWLVALQTPDIGLVF